MELELGAEGGGKTQGNKKKRQTGKNAKKIYKTDFHKWPFTAKAFKSLPILHFWNL